VFSEVQASKFGLLSDNLEYLIKQHLSHIVGAGVKEFYYNWFPICIVESDHMPHSVFSE
jgi:hypothetical protein